MPAEDPLMSVGDRQPSRPIARTSSSEPIAPFGVRFAVRTSQLAKHETTYRTVTKQENTTINDDGTERVITDSVQREEAYD